MWTRWRSRGLMRRPRHGARKQVTPTESRGLPSLASKLSGSASVAQWKSSSVLRKGLGVRVPPGARLIERMIDKHPRRLTKIVSALRGTEARILAKLQNDGWET